MTTQHRITSGTVALARGAGAAPAGAWVSNLNAQGSDVPALMPKTQPLSASSPSPLAGPLAFAHGTSAPMKVAPAIVRVTAPSDGFDWGDAGIGAAGGFALSMIGIGTALVVTQRRTRHGETALTS